MTVAPGLGGRPCCPPAPWGGGALFLPNIICVRARMRRYGALSANTPPRALHLQCMAAHSASARRKRCTGYGRRRRRGRTRSRVPRQRLACPRTLQRWRQLSAGVDQHIPGDPQPLPHGAGPAWTAARVPAGTLCASTSISSLVSHKKRRNICAPAPQARARGRAGAHTIARAWESVPAHRRQRRRRPTGVRSDACFDLMWDPRRLRCPWMYRARRLCRRFCSCAALFHM